MGRLGGKRVAGEMRNSVEREMGKRERRTDKERQREEEKGYRETGEEEERHGETERKKRRKGTKREKGRKGGRVSRGIGEGIGEEERQHEKLGMCWQSSEPETMLFSCWLCLIRSPPRRCPHEHFGS